MAAPDKIYINGFSAFATVPVKDGEEYIRKDALMEWLEKGIQLLSDGSLSGYYISLAYKDMIQYLNDM